MDITNGLLRKLNVSHHNGMQMLDILLNEIERQGTSDGGTDNESNDSRRKSHWEERHCGEAAEGRREKRSGSLIV